MPGNVARRGCFFCATAGKKGYKLLFKLSPHLTEKIRPTSNSKSLSNWQSRRMTQANKQPTHKNQTDKEATALVSSCKADGGVRHSLENVISQLIIVLFHTLFIADLQDSYQRTIVILQQNRKAPTCRAESHLVSRTPVSTPPHVKPNWLAALGGGRVVESQGGTEYLSPSRTQEFCSNLGVCAIKTIKNQ